MKASLAAVMCPVRSDNILWSDRRCPGSQTVSTESEFNLGFPMFPCFRLGFLESQQVSNPNWTCMGKILGSKSTPPINIRGPEPIETTINRQIQIQLISLLLAIYPNSILLKSTIVCLLSSLQCQKMSQLACRAQDKSTHVHSDGIPPRCSFDDIYPLPTTADLRVPLQVAHNVLKVWRRDSTSTPSLHSNSLETRQLPPFANHQPQASAPSQGRHRVEEVAHLDMKRSG